MLSLTFLFVTSPARAQNGVANAAIEQKLNSASQANWAEGRRENLARYQELIYAFLDPQILDSMVGGTLPAPLTSSTLDPFSRYQALVSQIVKDKGQLQSHLAEVSRKIDAEKNLAPSKRTFTTFFLGSLQKIEYQLEQKKSPDAATKELKGLFMDLESKAPSLRRSADAASGSDVLFEGKLIPYSIRNPSGNGSDSSFNASGSQRIASLDLPNSPNSQGYASSSNGRIYNSSAESSDSGVVNTVAINETNRGSAVSVAEEAGLRSSAAVGTNDDPSRLYITESKLQETKPASERGFLSANSTAGEMTSTNSAVASLNQSAAELAQRFKNGVRAPGAPLVPVNFAGGVNPANAGAVAVESAAAPGHSGSNNANIGESSPQVAASGAPLVNVNVTPPTPTVAIAEISKKESAPTKAEVSTKSADVNLTAASADHPVASSGPEVLGPFLPGAEGKTVGGPALLAPITAPPLKYELEPANKVPFFLAKEPYKPSVAFELASNQLFEKPIGISYSGSNLTDQTTDLGSSEESKACRAAFSSQLKKILDSNFSSTAREWMGTKFSDIVAGIPGGIDEIIEESFDSFQHNPKAKDRCASNFKTPDDQFAMVDSFMSTTERLVRRKFKLDLKGGCPDLTNPTPDQRRAYGDLIDLFGRLNGSVSLTEQEVNKSGGSKHLPLMIGARILPDKIESSPLVDSFSGRLAQCRSSGLAQIFWRKESMMRLSLNTSVSKESVCAPSFEYRMMTSADGATGTRLSEYSKLIATNKDLGASTKNVINFAKSFKTFPAKDPDYLGGGDRFLLGAADLVGLGANAGAINRYYTEYAPDQIYTPQEIEVKKCTSKLQLLREQHRILVQYAALPGSTLVESFRAEAPVERGTASADHTKKD